MLKEKLHGCRVLTLSDACESYDDLWSGVIHTTKCDTEIHVQIKKAPGSPEAFLNHLLINFLFTDDDLLSDFLSLVSAGYKVNSISQVIYVGLVVGVFIKHISFYHLTKLIA